MAGVYFLYTLGQYFGVSFIYIYILSYLLKKKKKKKNISCYNRWEILMSWNFVISGTDGWYLFLGLGNKHIGDWF